MILFRTSIALECHIMSALRLPSPHRSGKWITQARPGKKTRFALESVTMLNSRPDLPDIAVQRIFSIKYAKSASGAMASTPSPLWFQLLPSRVKAFLLIR